LVDFIEDSRDRDEDVRFEYFEVFDQPCGRTCGVTYQTAGGGNAELGFSLQEDKREIWFLYGRKWCVGFTPKMWASGR
jgi:hypothetical protein